jgi:hypothetical protein
MTFAQRFKDCTSTKVDNGLANMAKIKWAL